MWLIILLILLLRPFIKGTFEYEKITRKEMVILPIYSFIMMIVSINTHMNWQDILLTLLLFALGLFIGWLQARGVSIKDDGKSDKYGRPIIKIRRNWPYLVGWIFIFALNIGMQVYFGKHLDVEDLSSDSVIDLLKDASSAFFIFWHSEWFVWVLTVASTLGYRMSIIRKDPRIKEAVQIKEKRKQIITQKKMNKMAKQTSEKDK